MYKIYFVIFFTIFLWSCSETMVNTVQTNVNKSCLTSNIVQVHGKIDLVFGLPSYLTVDCPIVVRGMELKWNQEDKKLSGSPERIEPEFRYGREYLFNMSE